MEDDSYKLGFSKWQVTSPPVFQICPVFKDETKSIPPSDFLTGLPTCLITYWSTEKLNSFRIKLGDIGMNHFYLHTPCVQQETARLWCLLLCFQSGKAGVVGLSSAWHTITQNHDSNQIQSVLSRSCFSHPLAILTLRAGMFVGAFSCIGGGLVEPLWLSHWHSEREEHELILTKGVCFTGCSPILLLNSVCYKMSFFPQYVSLATESQSVESSHGYCAVN